MHSLSDYTPYFLRPIRVYIALDSDLTKKDDFERYRSIDENYQTDPAIEIICIIGQGLWYYEEPPADPEDELFYQLHPRPKIWERDKPKDRMGTWRFIASDERYSELLYLLCLITNRSMVPFTHGSLDMMDYIFSQEEYIQFIVKELDKKGLLEGLDPNSKAEGL